jgi:hypothetical protein
MSELIDKLERAARGTVQPLGFGGAAKREKVAPLLLLGAVTASDVAQAAMVAGAAIDGAIVVRGQATKAAVEKTTKTLKDITVGVWVEEGQAKDFKDSDFQVFSSVATPIGSIAGEDRTTVMQVAPELDDDLLRTIDMLPVDAFLVSLADAGSLTISQLMRLGRVRGVTSGWLLVHLSSLPTKDEAEQLRDAGVAGVIVDAHGQSVDALKAAHAMLLDLPQESAKKKDRDRPSASVPRVSGESGRQVEPEPDEDDWDDD